MLLIIKAVATNLIGLCVVVTHGADVGGFNYVPPLGVEMRAVEGFSLRLC